MAHRYCSIKPYCTPPRKTQEAGVTSDALSTCSETKVLRSAAAHMTHAAEIDKKANKCIEHELEPFLIPLNRQVFINITGYAVGTKNQTLCFIFAYLFHHKPSGEFQRNIIYFHWLQYLRLGEILSRQTLHDYFY